MSLLPVMVIFGLSFPPIFLELLLSLALFLWCADYYNPLVFMSLSGIRHCLIPRCIAAFFT